MKKCSKICPSTRTRTFESGLMLRSKWVKGRENSLDWHSYGNCAVCDLDDLDEGPNRILANTSKVVTTRHEFCQSHFAARRHLHDDHPHALILVVRELPHLAENDPLTTILQQQCPEKHKIPSRTH